MDFLLQSQRKYVAFHDDLLYRMMITAADDCVVATGYDGFAAGYAEGLLIAKNKKNKMSQLQCGISL